MEPTATVFSIEDGIVTAVAGGPISIADLGPRTTERASHLEFNGSTNKWDVTDHKTQVLLYSHSDYDVALAWEGAYYNQRILES
jgi:hypothetical protein